MRDRRHADALAYREVEAWLVWLDLEGKAARTLYAYERMVAPLLRAHPGKAVSEFTADDVNAELRRIPPRSRYISRSIYNIFFDWLLFDDRITVSPMRKVPKMTAGHQRRRDIFSAEEVALLVGLPIPDGSLFQLLFGTGMRRAEARNLRRSHIDLGRGRLMVYNGKGSKDRVVPLNAETMAAVADLDLFERIEPDDYLWHLKRYPVGDRRRRANIMGNSTFDRWYRDQIAAAGVRCLNPHQTRHTYHQWLRDGGLDLEERQLLMGHESPETTVRQYGRIDFEEVARKVAQL
jgi:integrase